MRGIFDAWGPTGHASRGGIRVYFSPPLCMGRGGYSGLDSGFLMPSWEIWWARDYGKSKEAAALRRAYDPSACPGKRLWADVGPMVDRISLMPYRLPCNPCIHWTTRKAGYTRVVTAGEPGCIPQVMVAFNQRCLQRTCESTDLRGSQLQTSLRPRDPEASLGEGQASRVLLFPSLPFSSPTSALAGGGGTKEEDIKTSSEFCLLSGIGHFWWLDWGCVC